MSLAGRPPCKHGRLLRLVRNRIANMLTDEYAPQLKGYELEKVPRLLRQLDEALTQTDDALPKARSGGLDGRELQRLTTNEVLTVTAMLERAGHRPDNPDAKCVCEEEGVDKHDLAALTIKISETLTQEHITMYNLQSLAKAILQLHAGLGLVPAAADDGTDWSTFSTEELFYLDAIIRKAEGRPLSPPVMGITCSVCGYSSEGRPSSMQTCPVGCSKILPVGE